MPQENETEIEALLAQIVLDAESRGDPRCRRLLLLIRRRDGVSLKRIQDSLRETAGGAA
jgi:hypothetical protein